MPKTSRCFRIVISIFYSKLYIGIAMSMSLALSIFVLFISLTQLVNGVQFFIIFFLMFADDAALSETVMVALTSTYASL